MGDYIRDYYSKGGDLVQETWQWNGWQCEKAAPIKPNIPQGMIVKTAEPKKLEARKKPAAGVRKAKK